jgi:hypothetical protein
VIVWFVVGANQSIWNLRLSGDYCEIVTQQWHKATNEGKVAIGNKKLEPSSSLYTLCYLLNEQEKTNKKKPTKKKHN